MPPALEISENGKKGEKAKIKKNHEKAERKWLDPVSKQHACTVKKLNSAGFVACTAELHRQPSLAPD